jgi:NAD(P)-dependent dehydrogenase (short-subunit alcohol dehydrogenase family)
MTSSKDPYVDLQKPGAARMAVVTGASRDIGVAIVRRLVGNGLRVVAGGMTVGLLHSYGSASIGHPSELAVMVLP